jgi:hypothetical protein
MQAPDASQEDCLVGHPGTGGCMSTDDLQDRLALSLQLSGSMAAAFKKRL